MKAASRLLLLTILISFISLAFAQPTRKSDDEKALRAADAAWSKAASKKDLEKTISFYADEAVVLFPNIPETAGVKGARSIWEQAFKDKNYHVEWKAEAVEVAAAGDLAYVRGTYRARYTGANGKPGNETGKYLSVWKKKGAAWRVIVDTYNPDPAPAKH